MSKLRVFGSVVAAALKEVSTKGSTSIPDVQLKRSDLKRLGLA
jgi:hypothetical protein